MDKDTFEIGLAIIFYGKGYKNFLKRLKTFISYIATIGVHPQDAKKKVIRKYNSGAWDSSTRTRSARYNKKGKMIMANAGKSHRMNIIKLAYQNEFGASIPILPRYKIYRSTHKTKINYKFTRVTRTAKRVYTDLKKEQGYLLLDKSGGFVAYFKPGKIIRIPPRPFLTKLIKERDAKLNDVISKIILDTFINKKYTPKQAINKIVKLVHYKVRNYMSNSKSNHPLTFKAKGHKNPLIDEQDRLKKAIKYKIYKGNEDSVIKANEKSAKVIKELDRLLKSAKVFENNLDKTTYSSKTFRFKGLNPHSKRYLEYSLDEKVKDIKNLTKSSIDDLIDKYK